MNIVQPIKKIEDIQKIKKYLAKRPRNALLFSFGINTGLRISDILSLDVGDVKDRDYIEIREKKTNKYKKFPLNIGAHTLRKTFGYHHYKKYNDIVLLQKIFNHSSPSVTLRYIGIEQDTIDESYMNFYL